MSENQHSGGPLTPRIGLVLSAGGLRGAAHLGVLRRLVTARIPLDVIVGSSAGAMVGAMYAAVGLTIDQIIDDAPRLRGRHVLMHSLARRTRGGVSGWFRRRSGIVPERLAALEQARFGAPHHGVKAFGVVCYDRVTRRPWYFSTVDSHGLPLAAVVRASAAVPHLFPPGRYDVDGREVQLTDGGLGDALPCAFARAPGLDATHLIVSDCRSGWKAPPLPEERVIYLRPALGALGLLRSSRSGLVDAVRAGEEVLTDAMLDRVRSWFSPG